MLNVAGVEREVTLPLKTARKGDGLAVSGVLDVLMTEYGNAPPKAMMGMVKADPKIKITFDVVLGVTATNKGLEPHAHTAVVHALIPEIHHEESNRPPCRRADWPADVQRHGRGAAGAATRDGRHAAFRPGRSDTA